MFEVGSNIFELVEFVLFPEDQHGPGQSDNNSYGVNVAKVREVIRVPEIVPCLTTCPSVLGVFNLRGHPIPVIHLASALGLPGQEIPPGSQVIVTEFSRRLAGFVVAGTKRIRRVSWDKVLPPSSETFGHITGMMLIEDSKFIFILDFEKILLEIESSMGGRAATGFQSSPSTVAGSPSSGTLRSSGSGPSAESVVIVDDSPIARRTLKSMLESFGLQTQSFTNGEEAWKYLVGQASRGSHSAILAIISDVEMPMLDGYSLAKRVKGHQELASLPFLLHSSLTGQVNRDRAIEAGANDYVTKFNKREIVEALRKYLPPGAIEDVS